MTTTPVASPGSMRIAPRATARQLTAANAGRFTRRRYTGGRPPSGALRTDDVDRRPERDDPREPQDRRVRDADAAVAHLVAEPGGVVRSVEPDPPVPAEAEALVDVGVGREAEREAPL